MTAPDPPASPGRGLLSLGRFFGVPIFVAPSWVLIAALFAILYGPAISDAVPGISSSTAYLAAVAFSALLALCVLAHELGHTAMSLALGQPVRRIVIFLMGGVSEVESRLDRPRDELLVAAAGPAVSVVITGAALLGYLHTAHDSLVGAVLGMLFWSNAALTVFNLLPGLPLDGGRLLRAGLQTFGASSRRSTMVAAWCGRAVAVGVLLVGVLVRDGQWGIVSAVISAALSFYLWAGATHSMRLAVLLEQIPKLNVADLLRPGLFIASDASVAEALDRAWASQARGLVTIDPDGRPTGIVNEAKVGAVPPAQRPWTRIDSVARPLSSGLVLPVELRGDDLVTALREHPSQEYFVVHPDGSAAGVLATSDVAAALR